jgi:hypothetical protein
MVGSLTPEQAATELLRAVGAGLPPIDVVHIAEEHERLDVQQHADPRVEAGVSPKDVSGSLSGILLPADRRIWVNADEAARSEDRTRFTIAHELGHWRLHSAGAGKHARFCRPEDIGATGPELKSTRRLEREANRFAAQLLMPEETVRARAEAVRLSVPHLAKSFGVSVAAMQVRLEVLDLLPAYMRTK